MKRWGNSKVLTQASYQLVKEHPGMNRWTVRAAVHGAVIGGIGAMVGSVIVGVGTETSDGGALGVVLTVLGAAIVALALIGGLTAANRQLAGLVRATDDVLHGREPDEAAAKAAARSRLGPLTAWSAISVAVGALVGMIQGDGNGGFISTMVRALLGGLVASLWAVVTTLVLPLIVLEQLGAVPAIKRSAGIIRSTWGEAVFGSVRIGARFLLRYSLPGVLLIVGGIALAIVVGGPTIGLGVLLVLIGAALIVVGAVKAATCRNVFGVALYRWATGGGALGPFSEEDLRGAVAVKGRGASVPA